MAPPRNAGGDYRSQIRHQSGRPLIKRFLLLCEQPAIRIETSTITVRLAAEPCGSRRRHTKTEYRGIKGLFREISRAGYYDIDLPPLKTTHICLQVEWQLSFREDARRAIAGKKILQKIFKSWFDSVARHVAKSKSFATPLTHGQRFDGIVNLGRALKCTGSLSHSIEFRRALSSPVALEDTF
jgi:hypothetical protein